MSANVLLAIDGWCSNSEETLFYWDSLHSKQLPAKIQHTLVNRELLRDFRGAWACIDLRGSCPVIAVDPMRSRPLFYALTEAGWAVSDSIDALLNLVPAEIDRQQAHLFPHFGYTLGRATLLKGIYSIEAGESVILHSGESERSPYVDYAFAANRENRPSQYRASFTEALDTSFRRFLDQAGDSQLVVPISGGLDSRLLLTWLKRLGARNVLTFSYGRTDSEASQARAVSEALGYRFIYVPYEVEAIRKRWNSCEGEEFRRFAWSGTSLPHIQDWEAVRALKDSNYLQSNAIFLPGHTIVGNMHDEHLLDEAPNISHVYRAIVQHHGNLLGNAQGLMGDSWVKEAVQSALVDVAVGRRSSSAQAAVEWFNLKERQAKYINNSMRVYEFYGYRWALPMLDREMWEVWLTGGEQLTATRDWYRHFVEESYRHQAGEDTELYDPRSRVTKRYVGSGPVQLIARSALGPMLNNIRSAFIDTKHPLAFEAFDLGDSRARKFVNRVRGKTRMGEWSEAFVSGKWGQTNCRGLSTRE